jgi:hypothetical protein
MPIPSRLLENFKYPLHKLGKDESAILKYQDIAAYADVFAAPDTDIDPEIIIRYLILLYTPNSPAFLQHPHVGKRKTLVMSWLDIEPDDKGHFPEYNDMLLLRGEAMRRRFVTFLSIQHSLQWSIMHHAMEDMEYFMQLRPATETTEALQRRKLIEETREQIENAMKRITAYDNSKALEDAIEWFTAQRTLRIRMEERIETIDSSVAPEHAREAKSIYK